MSSEPSDQFDNEDKEQNTDYISDVPFADDDDVDDVVSPQANASWIITDSIRDHGSGAEAFAYEGTQNPVDAYWWAKRKGIRNTDEPLTIHYRVIPNENTVEIWDNAIGLTAERLWKNLLTIGNPGDEKKFMDTGGSQGKGFWGMVGWGDEVYVETFDRFGERWCTTGRIVSQARVELNPIDIPDNPMPEIRDTHGLFIRVTGIDDHTMEQLANGEEMMERIGVKFAFAFAYDEINLEYEVVGDKTYSPPSYDFESLFKQGGIVDGEDLDVFESQGENRQLTGLSLIDHRQVADEIDPPWEGIAMLKGGQYAPHPYLSVWEYTPNRNDVIKEGKLWGWVDASELCPDLENHGHVGWTISPYESSGLKERLNEIVGSHYHGQTVEEQEDTSREVTTNLNNYMRNELGVEGSSPDQDRIDREIKEAGPNDPVLKCSSGKNDFDVGDKIPLSIRVDSPSRCSKTDFVVKGTVEKARDENGAFIDKEDRGDDLTWDIDTFECSVEPGNEDVVSEGMFQPADPGLYVFKAEMREQIVSEGGTKRMQFDDDMLEKTKPVLSSSKSTFNVGGVEFTTDDVDTPRGGDGFFNNTEYKYKGDKKWRTRVKPHDGSSYNLWVNVEHPEFLGVVDEVGSDRKGDAQVDLGTKWAVLRTTMETAGEDIVEYLEEQGASNSLIRDKVEDIIQDYLETYDEFCYEYSQDSPLFDHPPITDSENED